MSRSAWREPAWFARPAHRLPFIAAMTAAGVPSRTARPPRRFPGGFAVQCTVMPPGLKPRRVTIVFSRGTPETPRVFVDGPIDSPHRYGDGSLCMWYPYDGPDRRWFRRDGPVALLGHIVAHLVREEWWRRTGEWVGDEAPHSTRNGQESA